MKAVILCAGKGGRLRPLTETQPKCLLPVGGQTLLECCLDNLGAAGIRDILLVTGYKKELVEQRIRERGYAGVSFLVNERFAGTNTAFSLNLALKAMDDDFILANGDVLYHRSILNDLIAHPDPNCVAVDSDIPLDGEEIKVIARNGRVQQISKELDPGQCLGEAIGLYKIQRGLIPELIRRYDALEQQGALHHYFEKGFEQICESGGGESRRFSLLFTRGRPWVEIDTLEDYAYAEREVFPRICRQA